MKKSYKILIVCILAVIVLAGIAILFLRTDIFFAAPFHASVSNTLTYQDDTIGFSFTYPNDFEVSQVSDGTLLVSSASSTDEVQIAVSSSGGESGLTPENIAQNNPDMLMNNATTTYISSSSAGSSISAVAFDTDTTHEVWFISGGYLYQVSCLLGDANENLMLEVLKDFMLP